jgi:protein gp37
MSDLTAIEWTDVIWNPVTGCDRVSPGCDHCYAVALAPRLKAMGHGTGGLSMRTRYFS